MKIVQVDNFDRDYVNDSLIADNVNAYYAKFLADALNARYSGDSAQYFYRAVQDEYKLKKFEP